MMMRPQTHLQRQPEPPGVQVDRRHAAPSAGSARRTRADRATSTWSTAPSLTRHSEQVWASWATAHACFELLLGAGATGLHVTLCTSFRAGPALEEHFVIRTAVAFEEWLATAPTKFDHPVAHEEIRRFGHANLAS